MSSAFTKITWNVDTKVCCQKNKQFDGGTLKKMIAHNATHTHAQKKKDFLQCNASTRYDQQLSKWDNYDKLWIMTKQCLKKATSSAYNSLVAKPLGCFKYYGKVVWTGVTWQDLHRFAGNFSQRACGWCSARDLACTFLALQFSQQWFLLLCSGHLLKNDHK